MKNKKHFLLLSCAVLLILVTFIIFKADKINIPIINQTVASYILPVIKKVVKLPSTRTEDLTGLVIKKDNEVTTIKQHDADIMNVKAEFYDYYSDSQVNRSATPGPITDARYSGAHGIFNRRLLSVMKYANPAQSPTKYPMYLGNFLSGSSGPAYEGIYYKNERDCEKSNFWMAANHGIFATCATPGLVDSKLSHIGGESCITTTNPDNGRSAILPYFDKSLLRNTSISPGYRMSMGEVRENIKFPFRKRMDRGVAYYEFDSRMDVVRFRNENTLEYVGTDDSQWVHDNGGGVSFLPYNEPWDDLYHLNLCFGMKLEIPFYVTSDGMVNGRDIIFEFSGDDDVWIFVDDELVLDIGGCHTRVGGHINFRQQVGVVDGSLNPTVAFRKRYMANIPAGTTTFSDPEFGVINEPVAYYNKTTLFSSALKESLSQPNKEHMLTIYYMERAKGASNLYMSFNLLTDETYEETVGEYYLFGLH